MDNYDRAELRRQLVEAADALTRKTASVAALARRLPADTPRRVLEAGVQGLLTYLSGLDDVANALERLAVPEPPPAGPRTLIH